MRKFTDVIPNTSQQVVVRLVHLIIADSCSSKEVIIPKLQGSTHLPNTSIAFIVGRVMSGILQYRLLVQRDWNKNEKVLSLKNQPSGSCYRQGVGGMWESSGAGVQAPSFPTRSNQISCSLFLIFENIRLQCSLKVLNFLRVTSLKIFKKLHAV